MTPQQQQTLEFVRRYFAEHGRSPTQRAIREHFGLRSTGVVNRQLVALVEYGYLRRTNHYSGKYLPVEVGRPDLANIATGELLAELQRREAVEGVGR